MLVNGEDDGDATKGYFEVMYLDSSFQETPLMSTYYQMVEYQLDLVPLPMLVVGLEDY
jgi:hypothetical protein